MRLRKRAAVLTFGAIVLFLLGTNVQAAYLLGLAALLLGAAIAGVLMPLAGLRGLRAELVAPSETHQGAEAAVELRVTNSRRGVRWSLVAADDHFSPTQVLVPSVGPGERAEVWTARAPRRRGPVRTSWVEVRSAAPFGVAERRRRLPVTAETLVLPAVFALGPLSFVARTTTVEHAIHASPRRGTGPDYLGIREYRPGDSMRHVHWPSTARHGSVMVREFEEETTRRLAIVVDTERDRGDVWTPLDRACSAAASIATSALARGQGTRLAAAMPGGELEVLARADETDLLRWLARLEPSGTPLGDALSGLDRADLRGVECVVAVVPAWGKDERLATHIAELVARVPSVVCVVVGTAPVGERDEELQRTSRAVRDVGVETTAWAAGADLAAALEALA